MLNTALSPPRFQRDDSPQTTDLLFNGQLLQLNTQCESSLDLNWLGWIKTFVNLAHYLTR